MSGRCGTVRLLAVEAVLGAICVGLLAVRPDLGAVFLPPGTDPALVRTFVAADLGTYVVAPAVAAWGLERDRPWGRAALWLHVGAAAYAALWTWGGVALAGLHVAAGVVTTAPAAVFGVLATGLRRRS